MSNYFDYQKQASKLNVKPELLQELERVLREQYGRDEMMFELRMLRALSAIEEGATTIEEAIRELGGSASMAA